MRASIQIAIANTPRLGVGFGVLSAIAELTGSSGTEITFSIVTTFGYQGVEIRELSSNEYGWDAFSVNVEGTSADIVLDEANYGIVTGTTYEWRPYVFDELPDAEGNRVYGATQTIEVTGSHLLTESGDVLTTESGDRLTIE